MISARLGNGAPESIVAGSAILVAAVLLLGRRSDWRPASAGAQPPHDDAARAG